MYYDPLLFAFDIIRRLGLLPVLFVVLAGGLAVVAGPAHAQYTVDQTYVADNPGTDSFVGRAVEEVGTTGDGVPILIVGANDSDRAHLINANDGTVIETLTSPNSTLNGRFGAAVGVVDDVTGDGFPDVVVGAPREDYGGTSTAGVAYIFNGETGDLYQELQSTSSNLESPRRFGAAVAGVGDDVVVGAPDQAAGGTSGAGKVYLFDGSDGSVIEVVTGAEDNGGRYGSAVAGVGDVVGDNTPDFVVGAPFEAEGGNDDAGRIYRVNGNTRDQTGVVSDNVETGGQFGGAVASLGNGHAAIGAPAEDGGGVSDAGRAYVVDVANPSSTPVTLTSGTSESGGGFGQAVAGLEDLSGDGTPDVLVGAPFETVNNIGNAGRAYVVDGTTGNVLAPITSPSDEDGWFGGSVAGSSQPIVGAPEENVGSSLQAGRVHTFIPTIALADGRDGEAYDAPAPTPGTDENPVGRFKLSAAVTGTSLDEVRVVNDAPTTPTGVSSIELWSSSDDTFDGSDTELASTTSYSDDVTFSGVGGDIPSGDKYFFVVVDLASDASGDYDPLIPGESDLGLTGGPLAEVNDTETNSFSDVYLSDASDPLPVELTTLEATATGEGAVTVRWATASETNNAEFRVMRRARGEGGEARGEERGGKGAGEWVRVGSVDGSGTTTQPQSYQFTDEDLPYEADALQYRLRQVDTDGTGHVSDAVTVERGAPDQLELLGTYPNPARTQATVRLAVPDEAAAEAATLRLYDVMGREVRTVEDVSGGRHTVSVDVSDLSSGVYVLRLSADGTTRTQRLTVVR